MTRMVLFMAGWIALTSVAALGQKSSIGAKTRDAQKWPGYLNEVVGRVLDSWRN